MSTRIQKIVSDEGHRKRRYEEFCMRNYVPLYSQPWWMDAVCGPEGWDVWLCERGDEIVAAMPFYFEEREHGLYITKAPLTQNNGIVFIDQPTASFVGRAKFEEGVINEAMDYIDGLGLAVYEQQFQTSFNNWLPFSWRGCEALPRYTYVIADTADIDSVFAGMSSKQRGKVSKGQRNISKVIELDPDEFYSEHERVFTRQGLACPFSRELFLGLEDSCRERGCCATFAALDANGDVASVLFLVWDNLRAYQILGGNMPESQSLDTYSALIWYGISKAHELGLAYDFEGSMIERISKSFRQFGGKPELYFRIRKVYSPDVVRMEAERKIERMS